MVSRIDEEERNRIVKRHVVYTLIWEAGYYYHGSTCDFGRRKRYHLWALKSDRHINSKMQNVFNKHGKWNSECLLNISNETEATKAEQKLIDRDIGKVSCINIMPTVGSFSDCQKAGLSGGHKTYERGVGIFAIAEKEWLVNSLRGGFTSRDRGVGVHGMTQEQRIAAGQKAGEIVVERDLGIHGLTSKQTIANAKKGGEIAYKNELGIHARSPEQMCADGQKGGKISGQLTYERKIGVHGRSPEQMSADGKKGDEKAKRLGTGIYGRTFEQHSAIGKIANHVRWHVRRGIMNPNCDLCCNSAKA